MQRQLHCQRRAGACVSEVQLQICLFLLCRSQILAATQQRLKANTDLPAQDAAAALAAASFLDQLTSSQVQLTNIYLPELAAITCQLCQVQLLSTNQHGDIASNCKKAVNDIS